MDISKIRHLLEKYTRRAFDGDFIKADEVLVIGRLVQVGETYQYTIKLKNGTDIVKAVPQWTKEIETKVKTLFRTKTVKETIIDKERIEQDLINLSRTRDVFINQLVNTRSTYTKPALAAG